MPSDLIPTRLRHVLAAGLLAIAVPLPSQAQESGRVELSAVGAAIETRIAERVLMDAYARLGITVDIERFTGDIGIDRANSGLLDGEVLRIHDTERTYPDLLQVPVPLGYFDVVVYAKDPALRVRSWQDLRTERVGVVRGVMAVERAIGDLKVRMVDTYPELFALFAGGDVDVVVIATMDPLLAQRLVPSLARARSITIIDTYLAYHYLHRSRAELVRRLEPILKKMLLDGTIARIRSTEVAAARGVDR